MGAATGTHSHSSADHRPPATGLWSNQERLQHNQAQVHEPPAQNIVVVATEPSVARALSQKGVAAAVRKAAQQGLAVAAAAREAAAKAALATAAVSHTPGVVTG